MSLSSSATAVAAVISVLLAVAGPVPPDCSCSTARIINGWCDGHQVGYVAGVVIRSEYLFKTLDAHGHHLNPSDMRCGDCRDAYRTSGFCERHQAGFFKKRAYFSRLNLYLAHGTPVEAAKLSCERCRLRLRGSTSRPAGVQRGPATRPARVAPPDAATTRPADVPGKATPTWCDACNTGQVGNVRFTDRKYFDLAAGELPRLLAAVEASKRCEHCAAALFCDTQCPLCRISYEAGRPVETPGPQPKSPAPEG